MIEQSVSLASNGTAKLPGYEQLVRFGYTKNRGVYRLHVDATGEWEGLTIRCFWHVPDGKDPASSLVQNGTMDVPASVTAQPGSGCVTFEGSDGTRTVTSADLRYRVSANGGTVDAVTGEGQETWKLLTLDGTESWNTWGLNANNPAVTGFYTYDINNYAIINAKVICSNLAAPNQDVWGGRNAGIGLAASGSSLYFIYSVPTSLLTDISAGNEVASLKAYLAAQYAAGTPVQIAYKLATPTPFTATGAQPIPALSGVNTVLTDADSVTVTGRADPIKRIIDLEDAVASMT